MPVSLVDILAMSPSAFVMLLATVLLVVLILCFTFIRALHICTKGVKGADRPAVIAEVGTALRAFVFWRRK
ncbi:hypothetical protein C5L38_12910 [Streptomyces sp. WAC00288]|nr:hypothetical protein C5L38_12910 [Streptomyces sp. WAC00288]KYG54527.1 hypothetical protein AWI43_08725 [Streptomyces sp. WAC04657]